MVPEALALRLERPELMALHSPSWVLAAGELGEESRLLTSKTLEEQAEHGTQPGPACPSRQSREARPERMEATATKALTLGALAAQEEADQTQPPQPEKVAMVLMALEEAGAVLAFP